ncbi:hypothetical protein [Streptomyces chiangmaiensis]|uniref:Uncharacterized protein n=1 Tax=Streptomyces chiangmaiensis TaxID=766497 RepID=A0ABU7FWK9_9ACTN|nr:hypothetical protein [Streptomyces chiangmaiensis]MED7828515.1 hypothetical protein [Streptomyces chiangmaiensis]
MSDTREDSVGIRRGGQQRPLRERKNARRGGNESPERSGTEQGADSYKEQLGAVLEYPGGCDVARERRHVPSDGHPGTGNESTHSPREVRGEVLCYENVKICTAVRDYGAQADLHDD